MADETNLNVDTPIGDLSNLADAPDDALLVVEYLGKAYNSTLGQLKAALGAITSFERTSGDGTPGGTDIYTVTFANGGKLEMPIPIAKNGTDAVSPTAEVTETNTGWHIVITDKNGKHPFDISNGKNGANGVSPTAEVTATDTGWHVVITDKNGEHPFDITNGKNGANGASPTAQVTATDEGWHVVITDKNGEHPFDLLHGLNGEPGVSPDVSVQQVSGGYRVTITDKDGAHYFTLRHGESSSADWAQKYPDGAGYVKNRIAYKDVYGVDGEVIVGNVDFIAGVANVSGLMKDALEPGGKYVVRWNNQPYHCICKESLTDGPYIGNGALFGGAEDLEDTGEPFCIYRFTEDYYQIIKDTDTEETIFVEVYGFAVIDLKQMDGELLPEGYPYRETVKTDIIPERIAVASGAFGKVTSPVTLTVGGQYIVNWDGTEYPCVGKEYVTDEMTSVCIGDVSSLTGGESTGEPFAVVMIPADMAAELGYYARIYRHSGTMLTKISVTEIKEVVHPMIKEFIPEGVGVTDYNKLENRPVGVDVVEILPEITLENVEPMTEAMIQNVVDVKVGDTVTIKWNGVDYVCTAVSFPDPEMPFACVGDLGSMTGGESTGEPFVMLFFDAETAAAMGGGISLYSLDEATTITLSITEKVIQTLNMVFLPEGYPYKAVELTEILPETTVEIDPDSGQAVFATEFKLVKGKAYDVTWNGAAYNCTAKSWVLDGTEMMIAVGDLSMVTGEGESTGEPFIIGALTEAGVSAIGAPSLVGAFDGSTSAVFSISGEAEVVHKMDGEYLPDGMPYAEPFDDVIMAAWPESYVEGGFTESVPTPIAGNVYKVNWGGVIYECVAREGNGGQAVVLGNGSVFGAGATAHPFGIAIITPAGLATGQYNVTGIIYGGPPTNNEFSITGGYKVQKISPYCLPETTEPLIIRLTYVGDNVECADGVKRTVYTADKTFADVEAALDGETPRMVYLKADYSVYAYCSGTGIYRYFQTIDITHPQNGGHSATFKIIQWLHTDAVDEIAMVVSHSLNS